MTGEFVVVSCAASRGGRCPSNLYRSPARVFPYLASSPALSFLPLTVSLLPLSSLGV